MARKPRIEFPGALLHVIVRGDNRQEISRDDEDRRACLERLGLYVAEGAASAYSFCLMPNHVHVLVEMGEHSLSQVLQRLLTWRARRHSVKYKVDGGVLSNFPIELFISDEPQVTKLMGAKQDALVLGLLIDESLPVPPVARKRGILVDVNVKPGGLRTVQRLSRLIDTMTGAHDKNGDRGVQPLWWRDCRRPATAPRSST